MGGDFSEKGHWNCWPSAGRGGLEKDQKTPRPFTSLCRLFTSTTDFSLGGSTTHIVGSRVKPKHSEFQKFPESGQTRFKFGAPKSTMTMTMTNRHVELAPVAVM
jgi:hypothetical protein